MAAEPRRKHLCYFSISDINALSNGSRYPVVLSINCMTGAFQYDCFAEAFINDKNSVPSCPTVLRDILERRGEFVLLRAVGFSRTALQRMLLAEYSLALTAGIACGVISSLVAVLPSLLVPGIEIPYTFLLVTIVTIAASGIAWTALAAGAATRGELIKTFLGALNDIELVADIIQGAVIRHPGDHLEHLFLDRHGTPPRLSLLA